MCAYQPDSAPNGEYKYISKPYDMQYLKVFKLKQSYVTCSHSEYMSTDIASISDVTMPSSIWVWSCSDTSRTEYPNGTHKKTRYFNKIVLSSFVGCEWRVSYEWWVSYLCKHVCMPLYMNDNSALDLILVDK